LGLQRRLGGWRCLVGEDAGKVGTVGVNQDDFQQCRNQTHANALASHNRDVEDQDVDDDRAENAEPERQRATNEYEDASEELEEADMVHPAAGPHDAHELSWERTGGWRWHRHERMKCIGAKDNEHEAKQDAADESNDLHDGGNS